MASSDPVKAGYWYSDSHPLLAVDRIPSQLFTHLFAAFADVNPSTYEVTFPEAYKLQFSNFTQTVQQKNPNVKTLLSIGGVCNSGHATTLASMASQPDRRKAFIRSSITLAWANNVHGLSLHWLYPSTENDMTNLGHLLNEWRAAVMDQLLLVAAVNFRPTYETFLYPVDAISRSLDWINVLAYDFYSPTLSPDVTGPFAALKNADGEHPDCGDTGVTAWLVASVPEKKIVLGVPFYGYAWRLEDPTDQSLFPPADGPADRPADGAQIAADGTIYYDQIEVFRRDHPSGKGEFLADFVVHYFCDGNTWIAYNGKKSITAKLQYARGDDQKNLLGYFAWHLGADDRKDWTLSNAG
jgi:chitinase